MDKGDNINIGKEIGWIGIGRITVARDRGLAVSDTIMNLRGL
jgi:hypothetical protein